MLSRDHLITLAVQCIDSTFRDGGLLGVFGLVVDQTAEILVVEINERETSFEDLGFVRVGSNRSDGYTCACVRPCWWGGLALEFGLDVEEEAEEGGHVVGCG